MDIKTGRLLLIINPGAISTKFAIFEENESLFELNIEHSVAEIGGFKRITDQLQFRKEIIIRELSARNTGLSSRLSVVIGRGGLIKPIESGVYEANDKMIQDLRAGLLGEHASNLGGLIAHEIVVAFPGSRAFIVDLVVVDEMEPVARLSGLPEINRISIFHALNHKAVARMYASSVNRKYEDINLIVAHLGGGISVGAHRKGRVVDVNNALNGDGPFSPERSGSLPAGQLAELCFSGRYSLDQVRSMITGKGGMVAYLGTNSFRDVCKMAEESDQKAILVVEAAAYQIAREIGAMSAVLKGEVDAIILTGGLAYREDFMEKIKTMTGFIAQVLVYPGEDEIKSLAYNGLFALDGKIEIKHYS